MGSHNVVLGTNVTVGNNATSSLNIGGVLFGNGLYNIVNDSPYSGSANGKIGINQPIPTSTFEVSGSRAGRFVRYVDTNAALNDLEFVEFSGSLAVTASLPSAITCPGRVYHIRNRTSNNLYMNPGYIQGGGTIATNVGPGSTLIIANDGIDWLYFGS